MFECVPAPYLHHMQEQTGHCNIVSLAKCVIFERFIFISLFLRFHHHLQDRSLSFLLFFVVVVLLMLLL